MSDTSGTRVYVGNLTESVKKEDLEEEFNKYGKITSVWVAFKPPGFAFVEFENRDEAEKACDILNDTNLLGSKLRVEISRGRSRNQRSGSYRDGGDRRDGGFNRSRSGGGFRSGNFQDRNGGGRYGSRGGGRGSYDNGYGGGGRKGGRDSFGGRDSGRSGGGSRYRSRSPIGGGRRAF